MAITKNINTAALKIAAIENLALFTKFASAFNTYDIRNSKGLDNSIARSQAVKALMDLQNATREEIIIRPVLSDADEEAILDELYHMLKLLY